MTVVAFLKKIQNKQLSSLHNTLLIHLFEIGLCEIVNKYIGFSKESLTKLNEFTDIKTV